MKSRKKVQAVSLGVLELDLLRQMAALENEPMSLIVRRLIRQEANKLSIKPTPPDPLAGVPAHIKSGTRMDILHSLNRGLTFEQAKHAAGFNPDWTIRDD